jgi:hypothetical protein
MKKLLTTFALGLMSTGAFAQATPGVSYTDEFIVIDMYAACYQRQMYQKCDIPEAGNFSMSGSGSTSGSGIQQKITLNSVVPIGKIEYRNTYNDNDIGTWNGTSITGAASNNQRMKDFGQPGVNQVYFETNYYTHPTKVYLRTGIPVYLKDSLTGASKLLRSAYGGVLRNLNDFKGEIAKSHRSHLDRLMSALNDGIAVLDAKDKTGNQLYSVVDWRVQENARLVVVFGTVLDELLTDYDDVERLKTAIKAMRTLVGQLRSSYGWEKGLAGNVSKASSSLIEVIRLELQELASIKMAMGSGDFAIYMDLLKITRTLQAKVDASKSGDMKAQREIFTMVDLWNGKLWQDELGRLMNAGPDFKNLVVPKLSMLLFAVESVSDLSEQDFIMPDRSTLK